MKNRDRWYEGLSQTGNAITRICFTHVSRSVGVAFLRVLFPALAEAVMRSAGVGETHVEPWKKYRGEARQRV